MNAARLKVESEGMCRNCGMPATHCDAAHLWPRSRGATGFDDPNIIIPLCSRVKGGNGCHERFDAHRLDVMSLLTLAEELALVTAARSSRPAGSGIENARIRVLPSEYRRTP